MEGSASPNAMRLDKWLWAARLYKTRSLAADEVDRSRVLLNGASTKPARALRLGDRLQVRQGAVQRELIVRALSQVRGPAAQAQLLYEETPESVQARAAAATARRLAAEPALAIEQGRPTKRDRRRLAEWNRWSASADALPDADTR